MPHLPHLPDIVTVTFNPALDETVFLECLVPGEVNRATGHHRQAGGKGVNVSSLLGDYGITSTACGFLGEANARLFEELFQRKGIRDEFIRLPGETRSGIKIVGSSSGETTDINLPGMQPDAVALRSLMEKLRGFAAPGRWFVFGGTLPAGVSTGYFADVLTNLKEAGARVAVDTSGAALRTAIDCRVDLIKPNVRELEEILGHELPDAGARVAAARRLQAQQVPHVILSLGAEGALFATPEGTIMAAAPQAEVASTVGAGDALLAGYLAGLVTGMAAAERAKLAGVFAWCVLEDVARRLPVKTEVMVRMSAIETLLIFPARE